ncbi:mucin-2-like [Phymastichus coffea]|uniref:mucin-2-like n=1 Tax=Phymastichus coffea TaxID=108790 RepID=UPI00273BFBB1|nr:mucin-2-like [Phymastichus coffea]
MRRLELLSFLLLATLAVAQNDFARGDIVTSGLQRDADGVTTVLLVPAPLGKPAPPVGVLTKTARTFVQDGASTEYATQVVGTTLDNGRLYAKILSTSSRVFYDKDTPADPISPFVVYPSATSQDNTKFVLDDVPLKIVESIASKTSSSNDAQEKSTTPREDDNDILSAEVVFKPAKVRSDNLLTYTVKQDYVMKGQNAAVPAVQEDEQPKSFQPRTPKSFRPVPKSAPKKDVKPLATVTYHGFADFVTTVGDTVIVFSPSTAPAPVGRPATTIKGDATLRPDDGVAVLKIKPTSVLLSPKKTETLPSRPRLPVNKFSHKNLKSSSSSSIHDLEPSTVAHPEAESSGVYTSPLLLLPSEKSVTGLIKVIDSTTANKGTTTHYMSSVYGTYINNNYAQIVHTSSNVFFFPEDSTGIYEQDDNESNDVRNDTIESVITTEPTTESELGNDIIPLNQGRSIKGSSPKNIFPDLKGQRNKNKEEKVSLATRLLPSTIYKTFTYFTTFFIPGKGRTSTSIKSREVVSSEVTYLTELILPSNTKLASITPTKLSTSMTNKVAVSSNTDIIDSEKQDVEEIQLIFKTIFTTFTYLTTFYDDSTTSVSSRKVTATNVITQTVDPISASVDVDRLIEKDASVLIKPTKIAEVGSTHSKTRAIESKGLYENRLVTTTEETTESITTVEPEQLTTVEDQTTPETTTEKLKAKVDSVIALEPSPTPSATAKLVSEQLKTYYTTYTYFTTVFVDDETEVETRTEVFSNVVTETIKPTSVLPAIVEKTMVATTPKSSPPPEILAYLEALKKQKSSQEALKLAKKVQERTHITTEETIETTTDDSSITTDMDETTIADDVTTEKISNDGEVPESTKTDVIFTSSSGGSTLLEDKKSSDPEDQELSETNHHDVEPAPTLLLQTSYTTYTYFTTMYNGDNTDVVSRLKTVTNVVTETIKPTAVVQPESKTAQPLTYFTTFTYWTTFIKGDETATTSREETVSNVVTPGVADTSSVQLEVVKTYRPFILATPVHSSSIEPSRESKATSDNEITTSPKVIIKEIPTIKVNELSSTISPDLVTLYTTYTYFTTSYIGNSTVLNSRLETVTSISYPDDLLVKATPRAIGGGAPSQILSTDEKSSIIPSQVSETPKTGLLSTVRSSQVNDGTTTHYITDVYGTYIDGLYAQVVETSSKIELPTPVYSSSATPVLPTGVLYLNEGSIVDADELTTVYFTTKQIGTSLNGLYAKVIESTSTTKIDDKKLQTFTPVKGHRTGLVRLIKGHVDANDTITYYQSKVIGTSIDGRYAQIIESTSSYLVKPTVAQDISPSSTIPLNHATAIPDMAPSPAVIQSSISEDHTETNDEDQENENEDESDDKLKKKSRLTFSTRKRPSSAPPIRPFISRSRPTFNPKRKPQGATTITRSDFTPTITATLAGSKGSRFASSRGRATPSLGSSLINPSSSRRFSGGRRSSIPATSSASNYIAQSSRSRGGVKATPSSAYSGRRSSTPLRGSSARSISRSSVLPISSTRYRPGIRPSSTILKPSSTIKHEDQEDNANEYTAATLATEETPVAQEEDEQLETVAPVAQTTTESSRRANNPLLRFKRPPGFGSGVRTTTPRPTTLTTARRVNAGRQLNRGNNNRVRPTVSTLTTRGRQSQSSLFPPRAPFGKKPETTEASVENQTENPEQIEGNLEDAPVEEINDNDYEGSEQKEAAPPSTEKPIPQPSIRPFTRIGRGRRVRRQTSQSRQINSRFRRPTSQTPVLEERVDVYVDPDEYSKPMINSRVYGTRGRSLSTNSRTNYREDKSSEEYTDSVPQIRSRSKSVTSRTPSRVKPSPVSTSNKQFTLRDKESLVNLSYKRPSVTTQRSTNIRSRSNSRSRTGTNRYQDFPSSRRTSSRNTSRNGGRTNNRRITQSRSRLNSYEDYRDINDFDGTITVTHYVPTEVTIPVFNNGITEKRNIITAHPSTEVVGPDRYSTITNSDGRSSVVLGSEITGTNFQGLLEVTKFVIHETPTTKVSHTLTSAGGRKFSQAIVVPTTVYSVENIVSTIRPSLPDSSPLANILLSQLLLGQFGQQNPLATALPSVQSATPTTRYDTRATTYVTTLTKHRSTVIPLTFRGKEILTTLVDTTSDVVTATEFITDTVVVTPTVALPQANLNSLLLLLQQPQIPQQLNPLLDPLLAAAPLTQSNTLPGEVESRNQPVDFDYKPDSYEDLSDEDADKPARLKANIPKTMDKAAVESSVITLYVSGRRPGEFSTVLSTVKVGDESTSTKIKRNINEVAISASLSPSLLSEASEPVEYVLAGSEEPFDAHAPTQSLESVVGDVGRHISTSIYT